MDRFLNTIRQNEKLREMTCGFKFPVKGDRLIQVKTTKKNQHGTAKGWPQPLNRGGRLIQGVINAFVWAKIRGFENCPLNRGWPLNTGPLYTGSTVLYKYLK